MQPGWVHLPPGDLPTVDQRTVDSPMGDLPMGDLPWALPLCPPLSSLLSQGHHGLGCSLGWRQCCLVSLHPLHERTQPLRIPIPVHRLMLSLLLVQRLGELLPLPGQCPPRGLPHRSRLLT